MTFAPQPWRGYRRDALLAELAALEFWLASTADLLELLEAPAPALAAEIRPVVALVRSAANGIADELERPPLDGTLSTLARTAANGDKVAT